MDSVSPNMCHQMHVQLIHSLNCITLFSTARLQDGFCFTRYVSPDACAVNSFTKLYNFIQYCSAAGWVLFYQTRVTAFVYPQGMRNDWFCRLTWQRGWCICQKSLEMSICLWPEFDCPEVTLRGRPDVKIPLLLWHGLLCPKKKAEASMWVVTKAMEHGLEVITSTLIKK